MTIRKFVMREDGSDKFWDVEVIDATVTVRWGRSGAKARNLEKAFPDASRAQAHADKLVREKIAGGYAEVVDGEATAMNEDVFWSLVSLLDWRQAGDDDLVVAPLVRALARRPVSDIESFDDLLAEKLHRLDGERWAREIGEQAFRGNGDDFSQDPFVYARACVVANGRAFYESVLADPSEMPKDVEFEPLLYVASAAYEEKTGVTYEHVAAHDIETFANAEEWPTLARPREDGTRG